MKKSRSKPARRANRDRMTAKGREIVASLAEAVEVERAGIQIDSRLTVRTVEVPDEPKAYRCAVAFARRGIGLA